MNSGELGQICLSTLNHRFVILCSVSVGDQVESAKAIFESVWLSPMLSFTLDADR